MDIFQFAMEKERFSEEYYLQLAKKTSNKGLKNICNMLAVEERNHYKIVEQMSRKIPAKTARTHLLDNAHEIFKKMRQAPEKSDVNIGDLELFQKARDFEEEGRKFYLEKSEQVEDARQKGIFKKLADEEQEHFVLLGKICDFVARPQPFLDDLTQLHFAQPQQE